MHRHRRRAALLAFGALAALPATGAAAPAPATWAGPLAFTQGVQAQPGPDTVMSLDATGGGAVAWTEHTGGQYAEDPPRAHVMMRERLVSGALRPAVELAVADATPTGPVIRQFVRHRSGDVALLTVNGAERHLYLRRGPNGVVREIPPPDGVTGDPRLSIDGTRRLVLTWRDGRTIRTATRARGSVEWVAQPTLTTPTRILAWDVQPNGRGVAVWDDDGVLTASMRRAVLVWEDDGVGTPVTDLGDERARAVTVRVGGGGHAALAWTTSVTHQRLLSTKVTRAADAPPVSWTTPSRIDESGQIAEGVLPVSSLAVGPTGRVASAWVVAGDEPGGPFVHVRVETAGAPNGAVTEDAGPTPPAGLMGTPEVAVDTRGDVAVAADQLGGAGSTTLLLRNAAGVWLPPRVTDRPCATAPIVLVTDPNARSIGTACAMASPEGGAVDGYVVDGITPQVVAFRG